MHWVEQALLGVDSSRTGTTSARPWPRSEAEVLALARDSGFRVPRESLAVCCYAANDFSMYNAARDEAWWDFEHDRGDGERWGQKGWEPPCPEAARSLLDSASTTRHVRSRH